MGCRSVRVAALVILGLVLCAVPALAGCGESKAGNTVITVGVLTDFSGASSSAVIPTIQAFEDAILYYQDQNPIKGVIIDYAHYDHQFDYSRSIQGYQYLKARSMDLLYCIGPTERDMVQSYLEDDHMPLIGSSGRSDLLSFPWFWNPVPTYAWQVECAMQFIADTWDYSKGLPKIAHQGWALAMTEQYQHAIDNVLGDPAWSGKFEWVGSDRATTTNVTWGTSYLKFKNCDFIICSNVSNSVATFVGQMRALGYKGSFITGTDQFSGYWPLVQSNTKAADLYDCYYTWWGPVVGSDSDADWFQTMTEITEANHSDWKSRLATTGPITGWLTGYFAYDAISRAAKEVGGDKIDGDALKAALDATEIDFAETGNTFEFSPNNNTALHTLRMVEWSVEASKWQVAKDKWYEALSLPE